MEKELSHLLKSRQASQPRKSWRCADDLQLAAYVDGALAAKERGSLEAHLADCPACLKEISFLVHASGWPERGDIPPWLVTKAKGVVSGTRKAPIGFGWRWATATLGALVVVVFLVVLVIRMQNSGSAPANSVQSVAPQQTSQGPEPMHGDPTNTPEAVAMASTPVPGRLNGPKDRPAAPQVRNGPGQNDSPAMLFPRDGAVIKREALEFRWRGYPDAVFYEISIMTPPGEVVMTRQTQATSMNIPAEVKLMPAQRYFASVRAHLREGKTARSSIVSFRVTE